MILQRIGKGLSPTDGVPRETTVAVAAAASSAAGRQRETAPRKEIERGRTYTFEEHFGDKPQVIVDLYTHLHERVLGLSSDVERVFRKQYVGYRVGKTIFCSVIPQKHRLRLVLNIEPARVADHPLARDITGVGHWGVGNTEMALDGEEHLDDVMRWIGEAAAEAART